MTSSRNLAPISRQVTPWPEAGLYVGFVNVLEWPKLMNSGEEPPFAYDVTRLPTHLLPAGLPPRNFAMPLGVLRQHTSCPLAQVMRTYLATSRDGVHFDLDWVYAQQAARLT